MYRLSKDNLSIDGLDLSVIAGRYAVRRSEFHYAEISGHADTVGWQIIVFYKRNASVPSAVCISDTGENDILLHVAEALIDAIGFDIHIGDPITDHMWLWEMPHTRDDGFWENTTEYHFWSEDDCWLTLGVTNDRISKIELIFDSEIIAAVKEVRA